MAKRSIQERAVEANERCSHFLAEANEAAERGESDKAEKLYLKSQSWLDRYNKLMGDA